ncbi:MAG: cytochrome c [Chloroflexi bacterium]|nr:cytochrome c [Chloroflexota bacterium]
MTPRLRCGLLLTTLVLAGLAAACAAEAAQPTRAGVPPANVIATATVKAGGTPGGAADGGGANPGAQLFAAQGCSGCHTIKGQGGAVGPNLSTEGTTAATRKPGTSAKDYITESIVNPGAFVVPGYTAGVMPGTYGQTLTKDQIEQLVDYLLEQK